MLTDNWLIKTLDTVESTQDYAKNLGIFDRQIAITARHQTKGYGQHGRDWVGIPDNLCVSLVIPVEKISSDVTLITGMALGDVILNHGVNIQYKWVNDILIDGKKVAGILTEYFKDHLIIGIGVNIKHSPQHISGITATNLLENGINISSDKFLDLLLKSFTQTYNRWLQHEFKSFRSIWKSRAYKLNEYVTVTDKSSTVSGIFFDIDESGCIIIQNEDGFQTVQRGSLR